MNIPFISITDFMLEEQVRRMLLAFENSANESLPHKLAVGVMTDRRIINGLPSKFDKVFPKDEDIEKIFIDHPRVFNVLHYVDYQGINICDNLVIAVLTAGANVAAIQLDMVWPDPREIIAFRRVCAYTKIIIQINPKAFEQVDEDQIKLIEKLSEYSGSIDYVLLDRSMGKGKEMSADSLFPYLNAISVTSSHPYGLVVAGGLGPNTLHLVEPIVEAYPDVSIDAQGKLRPSGSYYDPVDWNMAEEYLTKSVEMFNRYQGPA